MAAANEPTLAFVSGGTPGDSMNLYGALGRESISKLFEIELYLGRDEVPLSDDDIASILHAPCAIAVGPGPNDVIHGLLRRIRLLDTGGAHAPRYLATLVPSAWLFTLARTNRIFQDMTVPAMIQAVLSKYGLTIGSDYDVLTSGTFATREYAVQYEESDWDFLQRWMEAEGLFYWFEHGGERDKILISDSNRYATPAGEPSTIAYRRRNDLPSAEPTIAEWAREDKRLPARVAVFDYNYRTPHIRLVAKAAVDAARGFGSVMHYNEHFKTLNDGASVARVRAEQIQSEGRIFSGVTDCARLRAGHLFELTDHHDASLDGSYLVTSVEFRAGMPVPVGDDARAVPESEAGSAGNEGGVPYKAKITAIPILTPYRPARVTPKPRIHGVMHAHIDAEGSGELAQVDDAGRYKVRLPFDSGSATGVAASRWIRMAQPASGTGYGAHQPLHKGAEVLLSHIDGDPDRPIIVASVPNAHTVSPVTSANSTQSVINTHSGIRIEMDDRQSPQ